MTALVLAAPSKGRLQEQAEGYFADCGLPIARAGRGYAASMPARPDVEVRLVSAGDIARALAAGEAHLGVTGEDVLREADPDLRGAALIAPLGFGHAELTLAIPTAWVDVADIGDFAAVCAEHRARVGERLRVATKYPVQSRRFLDRAGVGDYRLVESPGATEGAPASGHADAIIDITTTGATLAANHLRPAPGGLILKSQAHLVASRRARWTPEARAAAEALLDILHARAAARASALLIVRAPPEARGAVLKTAADLGCTPAADPEVLSFHCPRPAALDAAAALQAAGGAVTVSAPDFLFSRPNPLLSALTNALQDL